LVEIEGERCSDADSGEEGMRASVVAGRDAPLILEQPPPRLEAVAPHADETEGNCNHATIML
jgi:hypothetical protein